MFRSFRGWIAGILILALVLVPVAGTILAVQFGPRVESPRPPDAEVAALTRDLARTMQGMVRASAAQGGAEVSLDQINAALIAAGRARPGLGGVARIEEGVLLVDVSVELAALVSMVPEGLWSNLHLGIGSSDDGPRLVSARIGDLPVPPVLALGAIGMALDRLFGEGLGDVLIGGIDQVRVADDSVAVTYELSEADREIVFGRLKDRVRALAGGADAARINTHLWLIDRAGDERQLPSGGSVLPYLRHVVEGAAPRSESTNREELKAALLALTLYCGEDAIGPAIGAILPEGMRGARNHCEGTTLGGRDDLKRHFIVSAGIYAASTGDTAFAMGEMKELLDSNDGGTGFSFDDIAADLAGARFAEVFLSAPSSDWPRLLDLIAGEGDVLPPIEGLPSGLSEAAFRDRYGDVDSAQYRAEIAGIARRINAMPLYAGAPAN